MFVKPAAGRMVRWPRTMTPLREAGEHVPEDSYWLRALRDKDVVEAKPPADPDAATPAVDAAAPRQVDEQPAELVPVAAAAAPVAAPERETRP